MASCTDSPLTNDSYFDEVCDDDLWAMLDTCVDSEEKAAGQKTDDTQQKGGCVACNSTDLSFDSTKSIHICNDCGAEFGEVLDNRPERNNYENNGDVARCGIATSEFCPDASMATSINTGGRYGIINKIHTWYNGIGYKQRARLEVLRNLELNMKKHKITKAIIESAKHYYKDISEMKHQDGPNKGETIIIRGINRQTLIAACAFYGAKIQKSPRTSEEIAEIFNLDSTKVNEGIRKFRELINTNAVVYEFSPVLAEDFVERYGCGLNLKRCQIDLATRVAKNVRRLNLSTDHKATSVAVCSIFIITQEYGLKNITIKTISDEFGISEVTIHKTLKQLTKYKKILMNDMATEKMLEKINQKITQDPTIVKKKQEECIFVNPISGCTTPDGQLSLTTSSITIDTATISSMNNDQVKEKKKRGRPKKVKPEVNIVFE